MDKIGRWSFIIGLVLAVLAGLVPQAAWVTWVLIVLGLVVGFLNVTGKESQGFLLAAIALALSASAVQAVPFIGGSATNILSYVVTFISAAMLVVAVKVILETTKN